MTTQTLTQESLKEWFDYDGKNLSWKDKSRHTLMCKSKFGYPVIRFANGARLVHRLVYLFVHGNYPKTIDHIDGNIENNAIENLRACTQAENMLNKTVQSNNKSGFKGVFFNKSSNNWRACVAKNGRQYKPCGFKTAEDAYEFACLLREFVHGSFANHGAKGVLN